MSIWTSVTAVIEFEIFGDIPNKVKEIDKLVGRELLFKELMEMTDEEYDTVIKNEKLLPMGSEGTLKKTSVLRVINENFNSSYTVTINGAIRDFNDEDKLQDWFNGFVKDDCFSGILGEYSSSSFLSDKQEFHKLVHTTFSDEKSFSCVNHFIDVA